MNFYDLAYFHILAFSRTCLKMSRLNFLMFCIVWKIIKDQMSDDELVELPGGIDQLEAIVEDMNKPTDNSNLVFPNHSKAGQLNWVFAFFAGINFYIKSFLFKLSLLFFAGIYFYIIRLLGRFGPSSILTFNCGSICEHLLFESIKQKQKKLVNF